MHGAQAVISRTSWQGTVWHQKTPSEAVLFVLCATREINAAAGLRPRRDFGRVQSICLCLRAALCLPPPACLQEFARDCTNSPFKSPLPLPPPPPPASALLEFLLCGQIRAPAHTCLVRPNADLFLPAKSSSNQRPLQKQRLDHLFRFTQHTSSARFNSLGECLRCFYFGGLFHKISQPLSFKSRAIVMCELRIKQSKKNK